MSKQEFIRLVSTDFDSWATDRERSFDGWLSSLKEWSYDTQAGREARREES